MVRVIIEDEKQIIEFIMELDECKELFGRYINNLSDDKLNINLTTDSSGTYSGDIEGWIKHLGL